ncbi:restriction endonuclease subunit S [Clostridium perfringens]|uniref:restriction endonuclease subunit S n=1 Tax=Clostridium perfringens TaxID=1502 RepID=UPI000D9368A3|nr:restriction endonuclease subunit S [Clostridium perfringens]PWX45547.1 hypothetical protein CYK61_15245 [Clostridium perfringens]
MKISDIFEVSYGINLELNKCDITCDKDGINFVSRTSQNNGVVAKVKRIEGKEPQPAGVLTCAGGGSVLSTFVQTEPFYSGRDLYILKPKKNMSLNEKLFYAMCIKENAYRYNYGRQANKTLKEIELPDIIPSWIEKVDIDFNILKTKNNKVDKIISDSWGEFDLIDFFDMQAGKYYSKEEYSNGKTPLVSSKDTNNGVMAFTNLEAEFEGNCLTIGKVDMSTFYQDRPFCATSDVTVLIPKFKFNKYIGLFIKTIIELQKYKWGYGRQIRLGDCRLLKVRLPVDNSNKYPDFEYMEKYICSLPYGDKL